MRIKPTHIAGSIARTLLALTFLFSGFVKAVDPLGTVYKIEDYLQFGFGQILQWAMPLAGTLAVLLITTEMLLGICMLFNVRSQWTSWITLAFYMLMTPITLYIAIDNPVTDCGCFGDALVISNWQTFWKNVVLLALAITFFVLRKTIPPLFNWWVELGIALVGLGFTAGIMGYSYTHLPIIDFRPYKVGNNIYELMQDPLPDSVAVIHTMEKDGQLREVSNADYSAAREEGWNWISQETHYYKNQNGHYVPMTSFDPVINDLGLSPIVAEEEYIVEDEFMEDDEFMEEDELYSEENESDMVKERTLEFFEKEKVTIICMYDLNKANKKQTQKAVQLYFTTIDKGEECYFFTSSTTQEVMTFCQTYNLPIEAFYQVDEKPIKTIVRANPGMIVVQNGVVIEKHNMKQL